MSSFDDNENEMADNRLFDQDIEQLLSGLVSENEDLAALAPLVQTLRDENIRGVSDDRVAAFAHQASEIARLAIPAGSQRDQRAALPTRRGRWTRLRPRLATALILALLLLGMTGVAFAADEAVPGDPLYGLDRALEKIGIGDGADAERIAEAQALFQGGFVAEAMSHAAGAVDETDDGTLSEDGADAAQALRDAAEAVTSTQEGDADDVRARVAEMLNWMAANAESEEPLTGSDFGQMVAGFAKEITTEDDAEDAVEDPEGDQAEEPEETPGPPEGVPEGPPEGIPGGPPESVPEVPPLGVPPGPPANTPSVP